MVRSDYEPLLTKIRNRFLCWTSCALSFGGRLQLIRSVIASITNFWCAAFCIPPGCIDEIESVCSAFLWSGSPNITSKAKISWEEVCRPKEEDGLGFRKINEVDVVFSLKLIWHLFSKAGWLSLGCMGEAISPQANVLLGCQRYKRCFQGLEEVVETADVSENFPSYGHQQWMHCEILDRYLAHSRSDH